MRTIVGVSDLKVSENPEDELITYALGSCLGISIYDPVNRMGALLHVMLPLSSADKDKARQNPAMYVDTGFAEMLYRCYDLGMQKNNMQIVVAGGACMKLSEKDDYFKIGKRNITVLRKLLWKNGFMLSAQDVGGVSSRTMLLRIGDGLVTINNQSLFESRKLVSNYHK